MKKTLPIILALIFLLTLLSGCQSTTSGHEPESTEAFEETVGTTAMTEPSSEPETLKEPDSSTEESGEPTTAAPTEEVPETEPSGETVMHKKLEIEVKLPVYPDRYLIFADEVEAIDGFYCILGKKVYGGDILLSDDKKALLDYGAVMRVTYEGEEVFSLVAELIERENQLPRIGYISETGDIMEVKIVPFSESRMGTNDPNVEKGMFSIKSWGRFFDLVLEEEYQVIVPADTPVYAYETYMREPWGDGSENEMPVLTMKEFYDLIESRGGKMNYDYRIYIENGRVVKIEQEVRQ